MKMEETKVSEPKKFTYEELQKIAGNLSSQVEQLSTQLQQANLFNMFKRLDYCFKVLECPNTTLFTPEFVARCAEEIELLMATPSEESVKE